MNAVQRVMVLLVAIVLIGCAGMTPLEQRVSSGAAVGGALACFPGAAIGAAGGALWHVAKTDASEQKQ